jgi:hypothetical protein
MSVVYYWKTSEGLTYIFALLGLCGLVQVVLSFLAAHSLHIASPIVLTLVPLGVVLAQVASTVVLAETISSRTPGRRQAPTPVKTPRLQFLRGFATFFIAAAVVLAVWGLIYLLWFILTPITQPAYLVKYILANTTGAILSLSLVIVIEWFFKR